MNTINLNPQIWIGCLAAYNNGFLHGEWVDAVDYEEIQESIAEILKTSPMEDAEEIYVADYDDFEGMEQGEYPDLEEVAAIGEWLSNVEHSHDLVAMDYLVGHLCYSFDDALYRVDDVCIFEGSYVEYAEQYIDECYEVPSFLEYYIDYEKFANDMEIDGCFYSMGDGILITNSSDF